ncbi:MAG: SDR family NAD(P)-dependent oxidoreductase [Gammaproteobacteria bacterium]|jgi:NAD(P)-dependent dehydrogenase (short-subunit alcohol dehydrogenase family)
MSNGRIILITGASRGVGKGIAEGIARKGDTVICAARSIAKGTKVKQFGFEISSSAEETCNVLNDLGAHAVPYSIDLNSHSEMIQLANYIDTKFGRLDILVHAACQIHDDLVEPKPFWEKSTKLWSIIEVGLRSNYLLTHALVPLMIKHQSGLIVHISSHGARCYMHGPIYGSQKAGIDKMAFDMAYDLKELGVTAVSMWSGIVKDEKTQKVSEIHGEQYAQFLKGAASQTFAGKVIHAFYEDDERHASTGETLIIAELGNKYGITNEDGSEVRSDRTMLGGPVKFEEAVVY